MMMIRCNNGEDVEIVMGQDEVWEKVHSMILYLEGCWVQNPCGEVLNSWIIYIFLLVIIYDEYIIKYQIPCFATGKGYRVKLPRKNCSSCV